MTDAEVDRMLADYDAQYEVAKDLRAGGAKRASLKEAARIEVGMRHFLEGGGFNAFYHLLRGPARPGAASRASPCSG